MIRLGTLGDLEALRGVYRRASLSNPTDRERLLDHPEFLVLGPHGLAEGRTWVAVEAGSLVGFATWSPVEGSAGMDAAPAALELEDLFVDPEWTRRGVATGLVTHVVELLRSGGVTRLEVTAHPDALAFYRTMGFVDVGEAPTALGPAPRLALRLE